MYGENRPPVTDEPVALEKVPVEVRDSSEITDRFRGSYEIHLKLMKKDEDNNM